MKIIIFLTIIAVCIRTAAYAVWEIRKEKNIKGGVCVFILGVIALIISSVTFF